MLSKCITHAVLKHTWQREGREIQARFCCWTHQSKPRVTPLERKSGGAAPDLWMCRIWGRDKGHAMGKVTQLRGGCCGEQPPTTVTAVGGFSWVCNGYGDALGNICTMWGCFFSFWSLFCIYLYRNPSRLWNWAMYQCYSEPFVFPATNTPELCSPGLWPKLLHPRPYCPISSNNIPSSVYKQTPSKEVHGKKS